MSDTCAMHPSFYSFIGNVCNILFAIGVYNTTSKSLQRRRKKTVEIEALTN